MSNSVQPHRQQPTRLPRPWDSPGKNTGVGCHFLLQCMKVRDESEVAQSCPTLRDPMDCSLPGSSIHGIFLVKVLEWGAIAFSDKLSHTCLKTTDMCVCVCVCVCVCEISGFSHVWLCRTAAHQAPLSVEFSRQEYWSGLPCPLPGDLPGGIKPVFLTSPALAVRFFTTNVSWEAQNNRHLFLILKAWSSNLRCQ